MDLEETKKIIQNKIEADESTREVRSQIKSYIHQKQDLREGSTETFKPLIETSEAVKTSIDTQQNKLIKQLQDNQLALTEGLDKNRLAITSGFDKMDEVKKSDLLQLPGFEAIEHPEMEEEEKEEEEEEKEEEEQESKKDIIEKIKEMKNLVIKKKDLFKKLEERSKKEFKDGNYEEAVELTRKAREQIESIEVLRRKIKILRKSLSEEPEEKKQDPPKRVISFDDADFDSGLNNAIAVKILKENDLPLPSLIKKESLKTIKAYQKKSEDLLKVYHDLLSNKAKFDIIGGVSKAFARKKNPHTDTLLQISYYNVLGEYVNNINKLENIAKKKNRTRYHPFQQSSSTC